jgi:CBS domain-containing protein
MLVGSVMKTRVSVIDAGATAAMAAQRMRDDGIGCLPVTDDGRILGVVTDRDLVVRCMADGNDPGKTPVSRVMSVEVVCCTDKQPIDEALDLMHRHGLMRLPVLNAKGALVGILSQRDVQADLSTKRASKVTFYKELMSSDGHPHRVPVHVVYVTGTTGEHQAKKKAQAKMEQEMRLSRWSDVADGLDVDEPAAL